MKTRRPPPEEAPLLEATALVEDLYPTLEGLLNRYQAEQRNVVQATRKAQYATFRLF